MNYRHINISILFFLILLLFSECKQEEIPYNVKLALEARQLDISTNRISFGYRSNLVADIYINAQNTDWEIADLPDWVTAQPASGTGNAVVTLTAQENYSLTQDRWAEVHVKSSNSDFQYKKDMKVSQPVAQAYFETTDNRQFSFTSAGGTQSIEISSNVDWHVETTPSWITCSPKIGDVGKRTLTIKVDKNPNAKERSFTIIIQANNGKSISVSVRQDAGIVAPNENDNELPKQK